MIGHDFTKKEVLERVKRFWELTGPFPIPKQPVLCPVCRSDETMIKNCGFFKRKPEDYRCDVTFKCTVCSNVWTHGVVVPKEMSEKMNGSWDWKGMRKHLKGVV